MSENVFDDPLFDDESAPAPDAGDGTAAAEPVFEDATSAGPAPPPGPGIGEALGWTVGTLVVHVFGAVLMILAIVVSELSGSGASPEELQAKASDPAFMEEMQQKHLLTLLGGEQAIFLVCVLFFGWLRLRSAGLRALPLARPAWTHLGLVLLWVIPLAVFCGQLGVYISHGWKELLEYAPELKRFDGETTMQVVADLARTANPWLLLLFIAVFPAIAEEIVFRGVVGRGLVARYGLIAGVAITSILFAVVHLHPVHVLALLPLAVAIHVAYLASRSFWVPVLLHFLNNAWAVMYMLVTADAETAKTPMVEPSLPVELFVASGLCSLAIGWVFWKSRLLYRDAEGIRWEAGYATADVPAPGTAYRREKASVPAVQWLVCGLAVLSFWGTFATIVWHEAAAEQARVESSAHATDRAGNGLD